MVQQYWYTSQYAYHIICIFVDEYQSSEINTPFRYLSYTGINCLHVYIHYAD